MTESSERARRVLIATFVAVAAIAVVGVGLAMTSGSGDDPSDSPLIAPGTAVKAISVEGVCTADRVARITISHAGKARPTTTSAVEPWVRAGEGTRSTSAGPTTKLVAIGATGAQPREVLTLRKNTDGWRIAGVAACLDELPAGATCPPATLTLAARSYSRQPAEDPADVGSFLGQAGLALCVEEGGKSFGSRARIEPVTAFAAPGKSASQGVAVVIDGTPQWYAAD